MNYVYISLGAIVGAITRYQVDSWARPMSIRSFVWSTLFINLTGSFLIGLFAAMIPLERDMRLLLIVGFCGSYTTFSTYSLEIVTMMQSGKVGMALGYMAASALLAPVACYLGYTIAAR